MPPKSNKRAAVKASVSQGVKRRKLQETKESSDSESAAESVPPFVVDLVSDEEEWDEDTSEDSEVDENEPDEWETDGENEEEWDEEEWDDEAGDVTQDGDKAEDEAPVVDAEDEGTLGVAPKDPQRCEQVRSAAKHMGVPEALMDDPQTGKINTGCRTGPAWTNALLDIADAEEAVKGEILNFVDSLIEKDWPETIVPSSAWMEDSGRETWHSHCHKLDESWAKLVRKLKEILGPDLDADKLDKPTGSLGSRIMFLWHYPTNNTAADHLKFGQVLDPRNSCLRQQAWKIGERDDVLTVDTIPIRGPSKNPDWPGMFGQERWDESREAMDDFCLEMILSSPVVVIVGKENFDRLPTILRARSGRSIEKVFFTCGDKTMYGEEPHFLILYDKWTGDIRNLVFFSYHSAMVLYGSLASTAFMMDLVWNAAMGAAGLDIQRPLHYALQSRNNPRPRKPAPPKRKKPRKQRYITMCPDKNCPENFYIWEELQAHVAASHPNIPEGWDKDYVPCPHADCPKKSSSYLRLWSHLFKRHTSSVELLEQVRQKLLELGYKEVCSLCGKPHRTGTDLQRHERASHSKGLLACPVSGCGQVYSRDIALVKHIKTQHPNAERELKEFLGEMGEGRPFFCRHCGVSFKATGQLRSHLTAIHKMARDDWDKELKALKETPRWKKAEKDKVKARKAATKDRQAGEARKCLLQGCKYPCTSFRSLKQHIVYKHVKELAAGPLAQLWQDFQAVTGWTFKCDICGEVSMTKGLWATHRKARHSEAKK